MKGVLLCGGEGTRLQQFTEVINKHLIRVHDLPMAEYPLRKMIEAGIKDIMIVTGGACFAAVVKYFGSGIKWKCNIYYAIQDQAGGIAQALGLAKGFVGLDKVLVCLGDNLWNMDLSEPVDKFAKQDSGRAMLFMTESTTPEKYGVIKMDEYGPKDIVEKPKNPPSKMILTGVYMYGPEVFGIIDGLKPSGRGELEITDVNRDYIKASRAEIVEMAGWWSDCGEIENILKVEEILQNDRSISSVCTKRSSRSRK